MGSTWKEVAGALFWVCVFIVNALAWLVIGMMIGRLP